MANSLIAISLGIVTRKMTPKSLDPDAMRDFVHDNHMCSHILLCYESLTSYTAEIAVVGSRGAL